MYEGKKVAVVIPAYNVEGEIQRVIETLPDCVDEIIVVDDGSTDGTASRLAAIHDRRLLTARNAANRGVGAAMKVGYQMALERKADLVVKMDGDGQMDPSLVEPLLAPIVRYNVDYVKGNRLLQRHNQRSMPLVRLWGNLALSFLNKMASGYWYLFDPQNGFVAIDAATLKEIDFARLDDGYFFENSMLIELNCLDALVVDLPMPSLYGNGKSHMDLGQILIQFPFKLLRAFLVRICRKHMWQDLTPVGVLMLSGVPLFGFGVLFSLYHWIHGTLTGVFVSAGTVMIGALSILLGFQLILQGILLDVSWSRRLSTVDHASLRHTFRERQKEHSPSPLSSPPVRHKEGGPVLRRKGEEGRVRG